ncbi:MAG: TRAP transporter fused permease subunit [Rhodospirillaceae bacterium]|jgi:TRAP transporter 4TM/12TM fusion protein|nr:TRAP transporter fused permease subunit [Rhodospirillales bacterium]MBT3905372.1 TRAP transporter fused permease subunit [Rhodospirillaceae bacterium]MBT4703752.1 TRAP transporter fused permease subunit [Rhodospirillaceae bacterium]MBT6222136.1 TRAP transporter fused permease subunit [Rhodospirillaceae bacterium]MBT6361355.1 TRAP transporter fused permease subunit [Rhodospirillaceae bacterium]
MSTNVLSVLMKVGLVSEEMAQPRTIDGPAKIFLSIVAVGYSYFFIHISFFGPPVAEIFKGTFLLGTAVLSVILFKGRHKSLSEGVVWLDEIFTFLMIVFMCMFLAIWGYWQFFENVYLWNKFANTNVAIAAAVGCILGAALYWREANRITTSDNPTISDWLYVVASVGPIAFWIINNDELAARVGSPVPAEVVFYSGLLAAVSFDIARRIVGPIIPLLGFLFLIYSFAPVAQMAPGLFEHQGFGLARVMEFLMLEADGMTGLIVEVFATYVVIFVIIGAFLEKTGLGALFIDTTYRLTGQRTGGPGLASVTSSGLFGMISGSGVANVVTTGTFTIPLMKRVGYKPEFAGAVEAAASTGGSYMPPIMGAGAFLLAQLTETSYFDIIKIALIPALLYYLSVGLIVYIRAKRMGLHGVPKEELPSWARIIPRLHMLLPIPFMVYYLVIGDSAFLSAVKTICLIVVLKTVDLLMEVKTPWSEKSAKIFLAISLLFGTFSYTLGLKVGAPFSWFADTLRGLNYGDALFWTVACFTVLKVGELIYAATQPAETGTDLDGNEVTISGPGMLANLGGVFVKLVKVIWISMEAGAKNTLVISCIAGVLGILLSSATQSDLPGRISSLLIDLSFGLLPLTIFWVIIAGYVVGMGLPITASYVILVIFSVGALTEFGVPTLAAHLICYWVAVTSAVTPPVALAAYAASAIAKSDPIKTGLEAMKLASLIFIMPFLFVYTPLLLDGTTMDITLTTIACTIGVVAWAGFLEGHILRDMVTFERVMIGLSGLCLLLPMDHLVMWVLGMEGDYRYQVYLIGVLLLAMTLILQKLRNGREPQKAGNL